MKTLASTLIKMHENSNAGTARPSSKSDARKSQNVELEVNYQMIFDLTEFKSFLLTDKMDVSAWVDDLIDKSKVKEKIDSLLNNEFKKHSWFTNQFSGVSATIESIDFNGKLGSLNGVAVNVSLVFHASVSVGDISSVLTGIIPALRSELKIAGQHLEEKDY